MPSIGSEQIAACYSLSKQVLDGTLTERDAALQLKLQYGMNDSSAIGYVRKLKQFLSGETYTRTVNKNATRFYLSKILEDFGTDALGVALQALAGHIEYYEKIGKSKLPSLKVIHSQFSKKLDAPTIAELSEEFTKDVKNAYKLSASKRSKLLPKAGAKPTQSNITVRVFNRNAAVVAEVLHRAKGRCQNCKKTAPFLRRKDDTPYLEVHHLKTLAEGGEDSVQNAAALCPNCHRKFHYG